VLVENLTSALTERVQSSIQGSDAPIEWGSPLLSTTPTPVAIQQLALQVARAEKALGEIALEVQAIARDVRELAGVRREQPSPPPPVPTPLPPPIPEPEVPEAD
jgi:hypothetical protein